MIVRGNTSLIQFVLIAWIPLTLLLFTVMRPRRAVLTSVIGAVLFLPSAQIDLPGLPGTLSRYSTAAIGCLLGILLFDAKALRRFQLRWFDWPVLGLISVCVPTSVFNGLGAYDGFSEAYAYLVLFGFPYFFGRIYFDHPAAHRDLAMAIVIGALLYAPLSLWEIRMSPQLHYQVYGYYSIPFSMFARFTGFRPIVFMDSPLMLGMWMSSACILAFWLGSASKGFELRKTSIIWSVPVLLLALVFGKTVGAVVLFVAAAGLLLGSRITGVKIGLLLFLIGVLSYPALRGLGVLERSAIVQLATPIFPSERVESLNFRLENEDRVIEKALVHPWFGWGGWDRNRTEETRAIDGLWLSVFGKNGSVGLASLLGLFVVPVALFYRRFDAREWHRPHIAPLAGLAVLTAVYWVDCLSNGFVNPVYILVIGCLNVSAGTARGRRAIAASGAESLPASQPALAPAVASESPIAATLRARAPSRSSESL
jgi:O-antigen ligase